MADNNTSNNGTAGEDPLAGYEIMHEWSRAWLRSISRVWEERGKSGTACPGAFEELLIHDARRAFADMGFTGEVSVNGNSLNLWNLLDIKVKAAEPNDNNQYVAPTPGNFDINGWDNAVKNGELKMTLEILIPPTPETSSQALAIADYDAAGKVYPFTCCP